MTEQVINGANKKPPASAVINENMLGNCGDGQHIELH